MPPKTTKAATGKTPAKGATGKTPAKGAAKPAATKAPVKKEEPKKEEAKPAKRTMEPKEVTLKAIANVVNCIGEVGEEYKASGRCLLIVDHNGNVGTFLKYRDVNMIQATLAVDFQPEPLRKALIGSLKHGKPNILDVSDTDQEKILDVAQGKYEEIYPGCWQDMLDLSISQDENKWGKLYRANDDEEQYKNPYDYRAAEFKFVVLTNVDPPASALHDFFTVIVN
ncbi:IQAK1-like protein [Mya arenaria]|uniref:IQAK1-like protein n=1 Tax=Mya arenaria TaxID=6604 RepID=A0ABY7FPU5_MYAAR|nr:IQ motif and ankyrin repeat domain-containing protein 1-like [Mya arenaria]WAR23052.1 IQAK1-like protein [Mya arenaria]